MTEAIVAERLVKRYGAVTALDGLDLTVDEGTVMALLGPNGAGKTTAVRVFTTLLTPDSGSATVAGLDVVADANRLRHVIGLSGQYAAVDEDLTGFENLEMVGRLYHLGRRRSRQRAEELLERFDLVEAAGRVVKGYSGGMRRRLDLAAALVATPPVLFLDEPTTGLDPRSRFAMWDVIAELVAGGSTLLLTTQYLEEADRLADQIAVIDHGRVIASGTADHLKSQVGGERLELVVGERADLAPAKSLLNQFAVGEPQVDEQSRRVTVPVSGGTKVLVDALRVLDGDAIQVFDVALRRPTLDDVFLTLTGHHAEAENGNGNGRGGSRAGGRAGGRGTGHGGAHGRGDGPGDGRDGRRGKAHDQAHDRGPGGGNGAAHGAARGAVQAASDGAGGGAGRSEATSGGNDNGHRQEETVR